MKNKEQDNKGSTLIEVIVSVALFVFLLLAVFYITDFAKRHLDSAIKSTVIQADLRTAQRDIFKNVTNSTWNRFTSANSYGIYYYDADYRHALLMQSALKSDGTYHIDSAMSPCIERYVLYYIIRPPGDTCVPNPVIGAGGAPNPDVYCPHKWLVKKEINSAAFSGYLLSVLPALLTNDLKDTSNEFVTSAKVLAENVLDFTVVPPSAGGQYAITYNGAPLNAKSADLLIRLTSLKEKKYINKTYANENLMSVYGNLFTLEGIAEPRNRE